MRQLEWRDLEGGQRVAEGPYGRDYWIIQFPADHPFKAGLWRASCLGLPCQLESFHETPNEAMQACQGHIEQTLRDWL